MAKARVSFVAFLLAIFMVGCSGSEYRFGNTQRVLSAISVTPTAQTLTAAGQTAQFTATGSYNTNPPSQDLTAQTQWSSSAPSIVTVGPSGIATAVATGTATISATANGVTGSAAVTVSLPAPPETPPTRTLTSINVVPSSQTAMTIGAPGQFIAVGNYTSAPLTQDVTTQVIWSSSDVNVAKVTGAGLVQATGGGSATITANSNGVVGTATLTVTATVPPPRQLTSITVIPSSQAAVTASQTAQFIAIGNYIGNPATQDLTNQVTWLSSTVSTATINASGLATAVNPGTTTITALDVSGVAGTATLTVTPSVVPNELTAINIIPSAQTAMQVGDKGQFIAIGSFTGTPSVKDITLQTIWSSSAANVATVDAAGLTTAAGVGTTTITASGDMNGNLGVVGQATMTVVSNVPPNELTALTVIPSTQTVLTIGEPAQFIAIGTFGGIPTTQDMTLRVTWSSSDMQVATIDPSGVAIGINQGSTTIVATATSASGNVVTGTATLTENNSGNGPQLAVLTVNKVGSGSGTVTGNPIISCGSPSSCTGTFTLGTVVTLIADPLPGQGVFGGWSSNCTPVMPDPNPCTSDQGVSSCTCKITLNNDESVGAIFNLF